MVPIVKFIAFFLVFSFASVFAQDNPKLLVQVAGAADSSINKIFGEKLLIYMVQSGKYSEMKGLDTADYVCAVSITEALGDYFISARVIKTLDSQTVGIGQIDSPLNSLGDLTKASAELAIVLYKQMHPAKPASPPAASPQPLPQADSVVTTTKKPCVDAEKLISQITAEFPKQLGTCGTKMAANMALPGFLKNKLSEEEKDPQRFMVKCPVNGLKEKVHVLSKLEGATDKIESFTQTLVKTALSGGSFDVQKLLKAASDISSLTSSIKELAPKDGEECEEAPEEEDFAESESEYDGTSYPGKRKRKVFSLGFRTGFNFSHVYESYNDGYYRSSGTLKSIAGFQAGLAFDIAPTDWFHFQPNLMYMQKGAKNKSHELASHYIEIPFLLSLKLSVVRLNFGPYLGLCMGASAKNYEGSDYGFSYGGGFDIKSFYIGTFYNYGLSDVNNRSDYASYNRTFGFNLGYNL
jgi:hypothetical protein